ncbi:MAG: sigma-70 family RNA polymerase sigma factor [Thermoanaerobaculia bacterium]
MAIADPLSLSDEIARLLENCAPRIARVLDRHSIPDQDREDLLQDSLIALLLKQSNIEHSEAWLVGTVRNQCLLYWRKRRRSLYQAVDYALLDSMARPVGASDEESHLRHDLGGVLSHISEKCRAILKLRYGYGCDPNETAAHLGYQPSGIQRLTSRCLDALCRQMVDVGWTDDATRESS